MRYVEKYGITRQATDYNVIRPMRFAGWVSKATYTYSEYAIRIAFPPQQLLGERTSMFHFTYIARLLYFSYV
jgi:hypothetical protein